MKIKTKLILIISVAFMLLIAITGILLIYLLNNSMKDQVYSYLHSSSRARAEHIRTYLQDQKQTASVLAAASVYRDLLKEPTSNVIKDKVDMRLQRTLLVDKHIQEVFIIDKNGKVVGSSDKSQEGNDKSTDLFFINAQTVPFIKDVYYSETINKLSYSVSAPIIDEVSEKTIGVSVVRYDPESLFSTASNENGLGPTEENFIVNKDKYFITPSIFSGNSVILKQKVDTENVRRCFSTKEVDYVIKNNGYSGLKEYLGNNDITEAKDYRNVDVIASHEYIPETGWCFVTKVDKSDFYKLKNKLVQSITYIFIGSIIIWVLLSIILGGIITKPINNLYKLINKAINGDYNVRSDNNSKDEIGILSKGINLLLQTIVDTNANIKKQINDQTKDIIKKDTELQNKQLAIINILEDVEDEKQKAISIADDLKKFQMAVEGASDHIVITDPEGIVLFANKSAEIISGFKKDEIIGKKAGSKELWGGQMSDDVYKKLWHTIKYEKKPFSGIFDNIRKSGDKYEAAATIAPILGSSKEVLYYVGIERDVTKEKEIDRTKTEFVSLASHQLRTPLSSINWYTEMLLDGDAGAISKQQKTYLNEIYRGNQRMVELVNSLLNVSRLDLGTFEIILKKIQLRSIINSIIDEMKPTLNEKNQKIITKYPKIIHKFNFDPKLLRIIMQNLISNAIKYSPDDSEIGIKFLYNPKNIKSTYVIEVSDNGYGIPDNQKEKIFEKLFRADNVRDKDTEGTGLGLYIVKSILEEAGGNISFTSKENKGTTFMVTLPKEGMIQKESTKT